MKENCRCGCLQECVCVSTIFREQSQRQLIPYVPPISLLYDVVVGTLIRNTCRAVDQEIAGLGANSASTRPAGT